MQSHRALIGLLVLIVSLPASAGVEAEIRSETEQQSSGDRLSVERGNVRFESEENTIIIKNKTAYIVNNKDKSYQVFDEASAQQLKAQMGGAMAQLREQMKDLPPEQRAMVEQMMGGTKTAPIPAQNVEIKAAGRNDSIAGVSCRLMEIFVNNEKTEEICVADVDDIRGGAELMAGLKQLSETMAQFVEALGITSESDDFLFREFSRIDGFPLRVRSFADGELTDVRTFTNGNLVNLPDSAFDIPSGFRKIEWNPGS